MALGQIGRKFHPYIDSLLVLLFVCGPDNVVRTTIFSSLIVLQPRGSRDYLPRHVLQPPVAKRRRGDKHLGELKTGGWVTE